MARDSEDGDKKADEAKYLTRKNILDFLPKRINYQWDEDLKIKFIIREFLIFCFFMILVCFCAYGMVKVDMYYYSSLVGNLIVKEKFKLKEGLFIDYEDCHTEEHFWAFLESIIPSIFDWKVFYTEHNLKQFATADEYKILYENKLLGLVRMRQVRVRNDTCYIHPHLSAMFEACYGYFSHENEDREPIIETAGFYVKKPPSNLTATAWNYTDSESLCSEWYSGLIGSYGTGGYYLDFSLDRNETKKMISELKDNSWITTATRAVIVDFSIYNANVNLFCFVKLVMEFPPTGGVLPTYDIVSLKLIRYVNWSDYFILTCELVFVFFVILYSLSEIVLMMLERFFYFKNLRNYLDLLIVALSWCYIAFNCLNVMDTETVVNKMLETSETPVHICFDSLVTYRILADDIMALLVFFCWIKLFTYLTFSQTMHQFFTILKRCSRDIGGFAIMFLVVFIAFAQFGYLIFGTQVENYSTIWTTSLTLLQAIIGEFDYEEIETANRLLAPLFFIFYVFFIFFVLLNMFIAIINDGYSEIKTESNINRSGDLVKEYLVRALGNMFNLCTCGLFKLLTKKRGDGSPILKKIRDDLKNAGYTDFEIDLFFNQYNIDDKKPLAEDERERILKDLELRKFDFQPESENSGVTGQRSNDRLTRLEDKVQEIEDAIKPILLKLNTLIARLKKIEKAKVNIRSEDQEP